MVQYLGGGGFEALAQRHDVHQVPAIGKLGRPDSLSDCTHHCYSPLLWDPVLEPFYRVFERWGGGDGGTVRRAV